MIKVNVLTEYKSPNSAAFNLPLISYKHDLKDVGIDIKIIYKIYHKKFIIHSLDIFKTI